MLIHGGSFNPMKALVIAVLLLALAFGASSETAFFSLNRFQLRRIKERYKTAYGRIRTLLARPSRLLIMILLVSELVNLTISSLVTGTLEQRFGGGTHTANQWYLITALSLAINLPLLVVIGEITPKIIAAKMNRIVALVNSGPLYLLYKILLPVLWVFDAAIGFVLRSLKAEGRDHLSKTMSVLSEDDFVLLMEEGHREGTVDPGERKLIKNVFEFDDSTVSEVMTPISQAFSIAANARVIDVMPEIRAQKFSRVPVYGKSKKQIVGILFVKDLLALRNHPGLAETEVKSLMTRPMHVGPNMRLSLLFRRFRESKSHMAVVVNPVSHVRIRQSESGHFDEEAIGVVTLEDVLESIFGEIADERDVLV
ncbi:MAG: HlyC/CorC family transporter [Deltaproteobacteria bacterium]|nr:HlyC/CorC family transporter [Deltaproteobacteria bacterium]